MKKVIHWFRQDLRLCDNPALTAAAQHGQVLPIYILDDKHAGEQRMGAASRVWLHHSLLALNKALAGRLYVFCGDPEQILTQLIAQHKIDAIYWNRCYEPWRIERDKALKKKLGVFVYSDNGALLWEPWEVSKNDGTPYRVFTPFYRKGCLRAQPPREPLPAPDLNLLKSEGVSIDELNLLPEHDWHQAVVESWQMGEAGAQERLQSFLQQGLTGYKEGRNYPAKSHVSRLSPHLHFGEISPNQVWYAAKEQGMGKDLDHFLSELGWREFSYSLLYHFPELPQRNWNAKFDDFAWQQDQELLSAWQRGQTGYPLVDAGMRELWQTGYMHNRIRMVVGSFLVKNLLIHWHEGERWFWDCLFDADLANNSASWQWVAGCGADAAPYFRIFNPVTQGHKFDPEGEYTRRFVPELAQLPTKALFNPWQASALVLQEAGVKLGDNYPEPVVDLAASRERALAVFAKLKK